MPKEKKEVGRKECMDAMCQRCNDFNAAGFSKCARRSCPLYQYSPYAMDAPELGWAKLKASKTVGFEPRKDVGTVEFAAAVESVVAYNYGWNLPGMPGLLADQRRAALAAIGQEIDEGEGDDKSPDVDW